MEKRTITYKTETRAIEEEDKKYIEGVIPYNSESRSITAFTEVIEPTAFNKTLADGLEVKLFKEHEPNQMIARTKNNSLVLENRSDGLHFKAELNNSPLALGIWEDVKSGLLDNVSFGFKKVKDTWEHRSIGSIRHINEAKLLEISVVAEPWYSEATVQTRSYEELENLANKDALTKDEKEVIKKYINDLQNIVKEPETETHEPVKPTTPAAQYFDDLLKGL